MPPRNRLDLSRIPRAPEPEPEPEEGFDSTDAAALAVRAGSGLFGVSGGVPGSIAGGVGEGLAQLLEFLGGKKGPGAMGRLARIGTEASLGFIPASRISKPFRLAGNFVRSGALAGGGDLARQAAAQETLDPTELNYSRAALTGLTGGTLGAGAQKGIEKMFPNFAKAQMEAAEAAATAKRSKDAELVITNNAGRPVVRAERGLAELAVPPKPAAVVPKTNPAKRRVGNLADDFGAQLEAEATNPDISARRVAYGTPQAPTKSSKKEAFDVSKLEELFGKAMSKRDTDEEKRLADQFSQAMKTRDTGFAAKEAARVAEIAARKIEELRGGLSEQAPTVSETFSRKIPGGKESATRRFKQDSENGADLPVDLDNPFGSTPSSAGGAAPTPPPPPTSLSSAPKPKLPEATRAGKFLEFDDPLTSLDTWYKTLSDEARAGGRFPKELQNLIGRALGGAKKRAGMSPREPIPGTPPPPGPTPKGVADLPDDAADLDIMSPWYDAAAKAEAAKAGRPFGADADAAQLAILREFLKGQPSVQRADKIAQGFATPPETSELASPKSISELRKMLGKGNPPDEVPPSAVVPPSPKGPKPPPTAGPAPVVPKPVKPKGGAPAMASAPSETAVNALRTVNLAGAKTGKDVQQRVLDTLGQELERTKAAGNALEIVPQKNPRNFTVMHNGQPLIDVQDGVMRVSYGADPEVMAKLTKLTPDGKGGKVSLGGVPGIARIKNSTPTDIQEAARMHIGRLLGGEGQKVDIQIPGATRYSVADNPEAFTKFIQRVQQGGVAPWKNLKGQKGAVVNELAMSTAMGLAGGLGGAAYGSSEGYDPVASGLAGAALGFGAPYAVSKGAMSMPDLSGVPGQIKEAFGSRANISDTIASTLEKIPQIQRSNLLMSPQGLIANALVGPYGSQVIAGLELALKGDRRGIEILKQSNPLKWGKRYLGNWSEGERLVAQGELGRSEGLDEGAIDTVARAYLAVPATAMTTGDITGTGITQGAGLPEEVARKYALTSEPTGMFHSIANWGRGKPINDADRVVKALLNTMMPFRRTPVNILEQGMERLPGVGAGYKFLKEGGDIDLRELAVEQGMGAAAMGGGYLAGDNVDPETARNVRRYLTNATGVYSLPTSIGFALGQGHQKGSSARQTAAEIGRDMFPLPADQPVRDFANLAIDGTVPRGALPSWIYDMVKENNTEVPQDVIPELPAIERLRGSRRRGGF